MIRLFRSFTLAAALALAFAVPGNERAALAQDQQLPPQVQLTPELVEGFIASYPELEALGARLEQKYGKVNADPEDPSSFVTGFSQYADARGQMEGIVQSHGISSLEQWVQVAYSVMLAYSFSERGEGGGSVDSEMAEAIAQIKGDKSIPDSQKEQLITMLEQQMAQISQLRPPAGNIEIVSQYADQIRSIADAE
ncbi:hypothetical protein [Microbaculum marinum]|uniref:Secreted protein n=1 Tax=Microbaculum marinum TaxID=1764581 RepID=A0AAW9RN31_9HYPH